MSRRDVPEWLRADCHKWGRQKLRIWRGGDSDGHVDGWVSSILGRIREEREGAANAGAACGQLFWEVYQGVGLDVQRTLVGLPETPYIVGHLHYVWPREWGVTVSQKARLIDLRITHYFEALGNFEFWVFARLQSAALTESQLLDQMRKMLREELQIDTPARTKSQTRSAIAPGVLPHKTPERALCLAALKRHTIHLPPTKR